MSMRRLTTTTAAASATAPPRTRLDQARTIAQQEVRIRVLEASLALEQHRREELEAKYAKLKRHYARLERSHAVLQLVHGDSGRQQGITTEDDRRSDLSPTSPGGSSTESAGSPHSPSSVAVTTAAARALDGAIRSPRRDNEGAVIDLTSPVGSRRTSLASPRAAAWLNPEQAHQSGDIIAESPRSPLDAAAVQPIGRETTPGSAARRSARLANARSTPDSLPPPAPPTSAVAPRVSGTRRRHLDFQSAGPTSRPRPRLGPNPSDEQQPSPGRTVSTTGSRSGTLHNSPTNRVDRRTQRHSPALEESKSDTEDTLAFQPSTADSDEAASIALAQYLQRQENLAAMRDYQERVRALEYEHERLLERERHRHHELNHHAPPAGGGAAVALGGGRLHDAAVDPDSMTYEELLQLGEQVGDVKKERWRQVAVQVLSSLPTHRWTTRSSDDISCIICQYGFSVGDVALTLPCAHVFHEECVSGWVRENNSCPLCKLEIAEI